MSLTWIHENPPQWDKRKAEIVAGAPTGIFEIAAHNDGDLIPGDWWRVEQDGETVGYGWMDTVWGDAEILLAVDPGAQKHGVGSFIVEHLVAEASLRGLNYMYNVVRPSHPDKDGITAWLQKRGFEAGHDDERLMRRVRAGKA